MIRILFLMLLVAACDHGKPSQRECSAIVPGVTAAHGQRRQFVIDKLMLPITKADTAIDLDGDGRPDNQLGNLVGAWVALLALDPDPQQAVDASVQLGAELYLLETQSSDPALSSDPTAGVRFARAISVSQPDFSGHGHFVEDPERPSAHLLGSINRQFSSNAPPSTRPGVDVTFELAVFNSLPPMAMPLHGAHMSFVAQGDDLLGEIHGVVGDAIVSRLWYPAIAVWLTQLVQSTLPTDHCMGVGNPSHHPCVRDIFDVGDGNGGECTNPDGTKGKIHDGVISICEVVGNSIISSIIVPDLDTFDSDGNYAPSCNSRQRNAFSVGIGFHAVPASF